MQNTDSTFREFIIGILVFSLVSAQGIAGMIRTEQIASDISAERQKISALIKRQDVQHKLTEWGVTPDEAVRRVAALSDKEVRKISDQLGTMQAGGDGIYIGFGALLIIILFVWLLRR